MQTNLQILVDEAHSLCRKLGGNGKVADYIPQLATADPAAFGLSVCTVDGQTYSAGDVWTPFTMQSISKILSLACVQAAGIDPYARMFAEPSGDAFHSIVRLEEEKGRPRNPLINAGAIVVSSLLPGATANDKIEQLLGFLSRCAGGASFVIDDAVYQSERRTGYRNRALANYMKHFAVIDDPDTSVDTYFRQCAVRVCAGDLARIALFLAADGRDPLSQQLIVTPDINRRLLAVMTTCGLYDEVGQFALRVGLPGKSGVSGGILAIVPGRMSIVTYGPALGERGNSVAGLAALEFLSSRLNLSLFCPPDLRSEGTPL